MREMVSKEIDDKHYEISQFQVSKSLRVLTTLSKLLGEPLSIAMTLATHDESESPLPTRDEAEIVGKSVKALVERLDEKQVIDLIKELVSSSLCDGKQINFELHFQGKLGHLFKLVKAVLEVQYSDFLEEIRGLRELHGLTPMQGKSEKKQTLTGVSGG